MTIHSQRWTRQPENAKSALASKSELKNGFVKGVSTNKGVSGASGVRKPAIP
jgi:hypothetical protein